VQALCSLDSMRPAKYLCWQLAYVRPRATVNVDPARGRG
jgi:hypothetical protein